MGLDKTNISVFAVFIDDILSIKTSENREKCKLQFNRNSNVQSACCRQFHSRLTTNKDKANKSTVDDCFYTPFLV